MWRGRSPAALVGAGNAMSIDDRGYISLVSRDE